MNTIAEKIEQLTRRVQEMAGQQSALNQQLLGLMKELDLLKQQAAAMGSQEQVVPVTQAPMKVETFHVTPPPGAAVVQQQPVKPVPSSANTGTTGRKTASQHSTFEEFIGKNLTSKVGILVTIVGIFIGARYAIEHNLVSPGLRIIAGYISGLVLIGLALRLKKKYEAYSAVLMGGGLSVLYFITYIAYSFYGLLPQLAAFLLMLVFTAAIVYAALLYDRVIIAHLAQVGAYALPFLLSDHSGRYTVFFSYIAIINTGILVLSFRKYWKSLFYVAFIVTWIIFLSWFVVGYDQNRQIGLAWLFSSIYFLIFYATFLAYKLIRKEQYNGWDVCVLLSNAFIFYGIGMALLADDQRTVQWQGAFTVLTAAVHFSVSQVIRKLQLADKRLYYLVFGLTLVFLTLAIPVQFDGNWVTLLWTLEAVLVFVIGRTKQAGAYEKLGMGLVILSFLSLLQDWIGHLRAFTANNNSTIHPFLNITFVSGLIVMVAYGVIVWLNKNKKYVSSVRGSFFRNFYDYAVPVFFLLTGYGVFQLEIQGYFRQVAALSHGGNSGFGPWGSEVNSFTFITWLLYSMVFTALIIFVNQQWVKNKTLALASLLAILALVVLLLLHGLPVLNDMAASYFDRARSGLFFGRMNFLIRYLVLGILIVLVLLGWRVVKDHITEAFLQKTWWLMVYTISVAFTSFEYIHWMRVSGAGDQYKLGLSIIWGLFALGLIVYGIWKKLRYIRLAAMVLLIITLVKLFIYDLSGAGTVTKTVSFISLGVILLLVSYLYNRYKELLFGVDSRSSEKQ